MFSRFLESFDRKQGFEGIKNALGKYVAHPGSTEDYDIRCETERGFITFDIQESQDFRRYGDVRVGYVSSFRPVSRRFQSLSQFRQAVDTGQVTVEKWGKVLAPRAEYLVIEFRNGQTFWQIYDLWQLNEAVKELEKVGKFKTNHKRGEDWGSAFLAVPAGNPLLQGARPGNLGEILAQAKPAR